MLAVDPDGNITTLTPPRGTAAGNSSFDSTATYDNGDFLLTSVTAKAETTLYGYDVFGNRTSTTDPDGHVKVTI